MHERKLKQNSKCHLIHQQTLHSPHTGFIRHSPPEWTNSRSSIIINRLHTMFRTSTQPKETKEEIPKINSSPSTSNSTPQQQASSSNSTPQQQAGLEELLWEPLAFARMSWTLSQIDLHTEKSIRARHVPASELDSIPEHSYGAALITPKPTSTPTPIPSTLPPPSPIVEEIPPPPNEDYDDVISLSSSSSSSSTSYSSSSDWEMISNSILLDANAPIVSPPNSPSSSSSSSEDEECVICLESFNLFENVKTLSCGHVYHSACIDTWLSGACSEDSCFTKNCPTCTLPPTSSPHPSALLSPPSPPPSPLDFLLSSRLVFPSCASSMADSDDLQQVDSDSQNDDNTPNKFSMETISLPFHVTERIMDLKKTFRSDSANDYDSDSSIDYD